MQSSINVSRITSRGGLRRAWLVGLLAAGALVSVAACRETALTRGEAAAALEEAGICAQAQALTSSSVEISTNFTIGMAVEAAAAELQTFIQTQLPCAEVTLSGATLTTVYGAHPGNCTYRGQTYAGTHTVTLTRNATDGVVVEHTWTGFHNDTVGVDGTATVTWSVANRTRHVVHMLTWTRLSDGRQGIGSGDRLQSALAEGILVGFQEDGTHTWEGESGTWHLDVNGVQMRWIDAIPQAGSYVLETPAGKTLTLVFSRVDATKIRATISNGGNEFNLDVTTRP